MHIQDFFKKARVETPPNFGLPEVPRLFPGVVAVGSIHNAIARGVGPVYRKVGGRIVLERDTFIDWLESRPSYKRQKKEQHEVHRF